MTMKEPQTYVIVERREMLLRALRVRRDRDGGVCIADFVFVTCAGRSALELQAGAKALMEKISYRDEDVYVLLPHEQVSTRYLQFPSTDRAELEALVRNRLPVLFPLAEDEISWGFEPVWQDRKGSSCVFVNVARRASVDAIVGAVRDAGGRVTGAYFLFAAYPRIVSWTSGSAPREYAAVFVSGRNAEIAVVRDGKTAVIRRAPFDRVDASSVARELMRTVGRYVAFDDHGPVAKVYVTGDRDDAAAVAAALREHTVYEVETLDVSAYVERYSTDAQRFSGNMAPMLAFAEALPAETLSFLPKELREHHRLRTASRRYLVAGILVLAAFLAAAVGAGVDAARRASRLNALDRAYAQDREKYVRLLSMQAYLDGRAAGEASVVTVLDAYYVMHKAAAPGVVLSRFSFESARSPRFTASGSAETGEQVFAYVEKIRKSGMFPADGVRLNYYRDASVGDKKRVAFEVTLG